MAVTMRDLRAVEARRRDLGTNAGAATLVIRAHHRHIAQQMAEAAGVHRIAQQMAEAAGVHRIAQQMAEAFLTLDLREFRRQAEFLADQLGSPVRPVDGVLPGGEASARTLEVDWLLLGQLTTRAMILAFFLALAVAVWEEQADTAPAQALLGVIGALVLWNQIDEAVWKRMS